jgi:hypothetical protein
VSVFVLLLFAVLVAPNLLAAQEHVDATSPCAPLSLLGHEASIGCASFRLDEADLPEPTRSAARAAAIDAKQRQLLIASLVSVGAIGGGAINAFLDTPHQSFHFTSEGRRRARPPSVRASPMQRLPRLDRSLERRAGQL